MSLRFFLHWIIYPFLIPIEFEYVINNFPSKETDFLTKEELVAAVIKDCKKDGLNIR